MSNILNLYPVDNGDIEIEVPKTVTAILTVHTLRGNTLLCPVRNGVIKVSEEVAETLLSGNNGQPLPGYSKAVIGDGSEDKVPGLSIPTVDEMKEFLTVRNVSFAKNIGKDKLAALYAAECAKKNEEGKAEIKEFTPENYSELGFGDFVASVAVAEKDLIMATLAAEVNGQNRTEYTEALESRLAALSE